MSCIIFKDRRNQENPILNNRTNRNGLGSRQSRLEFGHNHAARKVADWCSSVAIVAIILFFTTV